MFRSSCVLLAWFYCVSLASAQWVGEKVFDLPYPYDDVVHQLQRESQNFDSLMSTPTFKALKFEFVEDQKNDDRLLLTALYKDSESGHYLHIAGQFQVAKDYAMLQLYTTRRAGPLLGMHMWSQIYKKDAKTTRVKLHMEMRIALPYKRWRPLRNLIISRRAPGEIMGRINANLNHGEARLRRLAKPRPAPSPVNHSAPTSGTEIPSAIHLEPAQSSLPGSSVTAGERQQSAPSLPKPPE